MCSYFFKVEDGVYYLDYKRSRNGTLRFITWENLKNSHLSTALDTSKSPQRVETGAKVFKMFNWF